VIGKARRASGDELSVAGFVVGLLVVVPGTLVVSIPPLLAALGASAARGRPSCCWGSWRLRSPSSPRTNG